MDKLNKILDTIVSAPETFNSRMPDIEKQAFREIQLLVKDLATDRNGNVLPNLENIKKVQAIKMKLKKVIISKDYVSAVKDFVSEFNTIADLQSQFFGVKPNAFAKATKEIEIDRTLESLTGAGYEQQVVSKLGNMLVKSVTSGSNYIDLVEGVRSELISTEKKPGMLSKYAQTMTTDALSQFTGQHIKALTSDLNLDWYMYVGSNKETTREFCDHLTAKKYVHKSELPDILKGVIDGHECEINAATGLPKGMIDGTNEENFIVYCGGYNCQHKLVPVDDSVIPKNIRDNFAK